MALPYAALPVGLGLKQQLLRATPRRGSLKCRASTNPRKLQISRPRELPSPGGPEDSQHGKGASLMPLAAAQAMLSAGLALLGNPSAAQAAADNIAAAGSSDGTLQTAGLELLLYLAKTLISWGVPGAVGIVLVLLATSRRGQSGSKDKQDDLPPFLKQFMKGSDGAEPREFLKITPLNDRLDSYNYSLTKVTDSKAKAATVRRRKLYEKNFGDILGDLSDEAVEAVLKACAEQWL